MDLEKIMDDYTKRLFRRRIPLLVFMSLVLLVGILMMISAR